MQENQFPIATVLFQLVKELLSLLAEMENYLNYYFFSVKRCSYINMDVGQYILDRVQPLLKQLIITKLHCAWLGDYQTVNFMELFLQFNYVAVSIRFHTCVLHFTPNFAKHLLNLKEKKIVLLIDQEQFCRVAKFAISFRVSGWEIMSTETWVL